MSRKYYEEHKEEFNRQARIWQKNHPDKVKQIHKKYKDKIKCIVLTYYGNGKLACVKCGFANIRALSLDHIQGIGNTLRKIGSPLYRAGYSCYARLKKQNYPEGYQTLCMNCQWIKKFEKGELGNYAIPTNS